MNKREQFASVGEANAEGNGVLLGFRATAAIKDYVVHVCFLNFISFTVFVDEVFVTLCNLLGYRLLLQSWKVELTLYALQSWTK